MLGLEQRLHTYEPLFGSWHICGEIGHGNFGRVYRMEMQDSFGEVYAAALKVVEILPDRMLADTPERVHELAKKAYESEISTMYALRGMDRIVHIDDHAVRELHENGQLIGYDLLIRMELLESLGELLKRKEKKLYTAEEIRHIGMDLSRGLMCCHDRNILHRDINPNNIFHDRFDRYQLGDFGIAKQLEGTIHAGTAIGTEKYVAPEVVAGEEYDARADIYSLGIVLYQLANNGYLPFFYADMPSKDWKTAVARRLGGEEFPRPSQVDAAFSRVILKACAFHPDDRFASAQQLYDALEALTQPEPGTKPLLQPPQTAQTALDFWREAEETPFRLMGMFGLDVIPSPEMRYMAQKLAGYPATRQKEQSAGVLTPRVAARLPAWSIRMSWFPFNTLTIRDYSSIGDRAFRERKDIVSLTCGGNVKSIGTEAFLRCTNLGEVNCDNGLLKILDSAFANCTSLAKCHLPDSVQELGERVFAGCTVLGSLRVPEGVQMLGDNLFDGCTALHQVTLPSDLRSVGQAAFHKSGLHKIILPDSCIRLGEGAFSGCRSLASVQVSLKLAVIPKDCFAGCIALRQFDLPFRLAEIRERAFFGCTALENIVIPEGVRRIGRQAFAKCDNLTVIRVPDSVQYIGEEAFGAAGGLLRGRFAKLTVVTRSGSYAWNYCKQCGIRVRVP